MSARQKHAQHALRIIDEIDALHPVEDGLLLLFRSDPTTQRFWNLIRDLKIVLSRLGFDPGQLLRVSDKFDPMGTTSRDRELMLPVRGWKTTLRFFRNAVQRELDSFQAATIHGVSQSDIDDMRKFLRKGQTAKSIMAKKGGSRQIRNLTLRVLEKLGEFKGFEKKPTENVAQRVEAIIKGLKIPRAQRS